jgi:perosamine synthetase
VSTLALLGGKPVRTEPFPAYKVIGEEEKAAVLAVMDSGVLSRYLGAWHPDFFGGPTVRKFEETWAALYNARHAIAVNSCTSGLYAAIGAAGVGPGDEVIVAPWSMSVSATAPLIFNAVPVFADIDPEIYCLSPDGIRARLTPRTRAIIVVHLFGQAADMDPIMEIARANRLTVIEDCAQAPLATYKGRPVGTLGHVGVFSLNYHKHIHTGEGGVVITNDDALAERVQYIRNHAEAVAGGRRPASLVNMIGYNFRLGEIEAAIGLCQIDKVRCFVDWRRDNVRYLEDSLARLPGLTMPKVLPGNKHAYYVHCPTFDSVESGVSRDTYVAALKAELPVTRLRESEGTLIRAGYAKPLYLLPIFQELIAYGTVQCPFRCPHYSGTASYEAGICPNAEIADCQLIMHELFRPPMDRSDLDDVVRAFSKVSDNLAALRDHAAKERASA